VVLMSRGAARFVRFLLSPPPEDMETRSKKAKKTTTVPGGGILSSSTFKDGERENVQGQAKTKATASGSESAKFGSSSGWGRDQLRLLGVDFYMQRRIDLNKVLNVNEREWTPQMRQSIFLLR